jgi:hypothetical protein
MHKFWALHRIDDETSADAAPPCSRLTGPRHTRRPSPALQPLHLHRRSADPHRRLRPPRCFRPGRRSSMARRRPDSRRMDPRNRSHRRHHSNNSAGLNQRLFGSITLQRRAFISDACIPIWVPRLLPGPCSAMAGRCRGHPKAAPTFINLASIHRVNSGDRFPGAGPE